MWQQIGDGKFSPQTKKSWKLHKTALIIYVNINPPQLTQYTRVCVLVKREYRDVCIHRYTYIMCEPVLFSFFAVFHYDWFGFIYTELNILCTSTILHFNFSFRQFYQINFCMQFFAPYLTQRLIYHRPS